MVLVWSGVGGCLWFISSKMMWRYTAALVIMYSAASSAFFADNIMGLMICVTFETAPLMTGVVVLLDMKK